MNALKKSAAPTARPPPGQLQFVFRFRLESCDEKRFYLGIGYRRFALRHRLIHGRKQHDRFILNQRADEVTALHQLDARSAGVAFIADLQDMKEEVLFGGDRRRYFY